MCNIIKIKGNIILIARFWNYWRKDYNIVSEIMVLVERMPHWEEKVMIGFESSGLRSGVKEPSNPTEGAGRGG